MLYLFLIVYDYVLFAKKNNILSRLCSGFLLGVTMNFKTEEMYIDYEEVEQGKYKPLNEELEKYFNKTIPTFSKSRC